MKALKYLTLLGCMIGLITTSCNKDEDDFEDDLLGVWYVTSIVSVDCNNPMNNQNQMFDDNCDDGNCYSLDFMNDNSVTISLIQMGITLSLEGSWSGDEDDFELCLDGKCENGTIDINDDEAIISSTSQSDGCETIIVMVR